MNWSRLPDLALMKLPLVQVTAQAALISLLIMAASYGAARLSRSWIAQLRKRSRAGANPTLYAAERISFFLVLFVGLIAAFSSLGLNLTSVSFFIGALGVGFGLGLQAVMRNFLSGVTLLLDRSLGPGDFIELQDGLNGEVVEVGSRATRLVTNDNVDVMVPNSFLLENRVVNWTRGGGTRRVHIPFHVAFGTDKELVRTAGLEAAEAVPFTLPDTANRRTQVWLVGFGDSGLKFELVVWPSIEAVKRPGAMHAAYCWAIEDALRRHGIEIPFHQLDLRMRSAFGQEGEAAWRNLGLAQSKDAPRGEPDGG